MEKKSQKKNILKEKYSAAKLPEHYRGYEALLEEDTIPTTHVPTGTNIYMWLYIQPIAGLV